ncbi:SDR family oxidoreductase [Sphingomonas sp. DG1-23]|uniref:SDR family oxidoreductase n=1 Tax=Sphingomonas sp. DG1-23 TaxID=3068316 RepID=UPI00273F1D63|nr:SDR family oxidoreductase [Sphingomonas sp. DG1-23]MDP5280091.1 SDR family oxidoreductase [Sphingomonas sp. DG1-23]
MSRWTEADIRSQKGRSAIVTGTGGLGYETALVLARHGAEVIIAGRNPRKGAEAIAKIRADCGSTGTRFEEVDLASLRSITIFCDRLKDQRESLHLLVNNAAVMAPPERQETSDGFELQFGTNYLGHFALTAGLLPLLRGGGNARVVTLSSVAARSGSIDFDDLDAKKAYRPFPVYSQSKLACLMFAFELHRRSVDGGWGIDSIGAHPGVTRTDLIPNGAGSNSVNGRVRRYLPFLFQPAWQGALPTLYAATSPLAEGGGYYGPNWLSETRGYPVEARIPPQALDAGVMARLWVVSEELTGASFPSSEVAAAR